MEAARRNHKIERWTVNELLNKVENGEIELNDSTLQRREIASKEWNSELIKSIVLGRSINAIHFAWTVDNNDNPILICVDGLQRTTALLTFIHNHVKIPHSVDVDIIINDENRTESLTGNDGLNRDQLINTGKEELLNAVFNERDLDIYIYSGLTPVQIQHLFVLLNSGNPIKDQERRNAYPTPIAEQIRLIARGRDVRDEDGKVMRVEGCQDIFDGQTTRNKYKADGTLKFKNNRYAYDELVAKMIYLEINDVDDVTSKMLDEFYKETSNIKPGDDYNISRYPRMFNNVTNILTKMYNWIIETDSTDRYFQKKTNDFLIFYRVVSKIYNNNKKVENSLEFLDTYDQIYFQVMYNVDDETGIQDRSRIKGQILVDTVYNLLVISQENGIVEQDTTRLFTDAQKRNKWEEQGKRCAYTGNEIDLEDCAGDHILTYTSGGTTESWNLAMVNASLNSSRGSKPWFEFMATKNYAGLNGDKLPPMPTDKIIEHSLDLAGNEFMKNMMLSLITEVETV